MRTHERVILAMLVVASVLAGVLAALSPAGPRAQVVFMAVAFVSLTMTLFRLDRTRGAMSSGFVSGGTGIAVGHPAAVRTSPPQEPVTGRRKPDWDPAHADPSLDGGSFSLAAGASPHPPE